ncbi:hypothetical protein C8Q72DRAFT_803325 [Fomitopsis betulina]|nr:hypothetical protein C8Q72DRAFT_803325 [Fomitopsis betulina]
MFQQFRWLLMASPQVLLPVHWFHSWWSAPPWSRHQGPSSTSLTSVEVSWPPLQGPLLLGCTCASPCWRISLSRQDILETWRQSDRSKKLPCTAVANVLGFVCVALNSVLLGRAVRPRALIRK